VAEERVRFAVTLQALEDGVRVPPERMVESVPPSPADTGVGRWDEEARQLRLAGGQ
jgi:hypothetical protein